MQAEKGEAAMISPNGDITDEPEELMVTKGGSSTIYVSTSSSHLPKFLPFTLLVQAFALILRTKGCLLRDLGKYVR